MPKKKQKYYFSIKINIIIEKNKEYIIKTVKKQTKNSL